MDILPANLRDLGSLRRVEQACFLKDAWPLLDLIAVLTWPEIIRLKAVENDQMIGFIAGDPRPSEKLAWIATVGVIPEYQRRGIGRALLRECEKRLVPNHEFVCACGSPMILPSIYTSRKVTLPLTPGGNITMITRTPWSWKRFDN